MENIPLYRPDMIFLDVLMPRLDGYRTCALIRSNADYQNIPVVFLSATDDSEEFNRCRRVGGNSYLPKPFTPAALLLSLAVHLPAAARNALLEMPPSGFRRNHFTAALARIAA